MVTTVNPSSLLAREGLMMIVRGDIADRPKFWSNYVDTQTTTQLFERIYGVSSFGYAQKTNEGSPVNYDNLVSIGSKDFYPVTYTIGFRITMQGEDTDYYSILSRPAPDLAKALNDTKELVVANLIANDGFTALSDSTNLGIDGVTLYSFSHPIAGGLTASNRGDGSNELDLQYDNIETALTQLLDQVGHRNKPAPQSGPFVMTVHPTKYPLASRLCRSNLMPGVNDNDDNFVKGFVEPVWNPYFTNENAWILSQKNKSANPYGLLQRAGLFSKEDEDIDNLTKKYVVGETYVGILKEWRGVWGTEGV